METNSEFLPMKDTYRHMYHNKDAEKVQIADLIPYPKNPKKHGANITELAHAIDKRGWTFNILIDQNNRVIAGHGRLLAAKMLKCSKVPCTRINISDEEYFKIMLEDNKLSAISKTSRKLEREVMELLQGMEAAIDDIPGYDAEEIDKIFGLATKETIDGTGDFGDGEEIDGTIDPDARVVSMTFKLPAKNHAKIKDVLTAVKSENEFDTLSEALIFCMSSFKGTTKTIRR